MLTFNEAGFVAVEVTANILYISAIPRRQLLGSHNALTAILDDLQITRCYRY
jgi:hypothetical protein